MFFKDHFLNYIQSTLRFWYQTKANTCSIFPIYFVPSKRNSKVSEQQVTLNPDCYLLEFIWIRIGKCDYWNGIISSFVKPGGCQTQSISRHLQQIGCQIVANNFQIRLCKVKHYGIIDIHKAQRQLFICHLIYVVKQ